MTAEFVFRSPAELLEATGLYYKVQQWMGLLEATGSSAPVCLANQSLFQAPGFSKRQTPAFVGGIKSGNGEPDLIRSVSSDARLSETR